jgi:hypothetical protein
MNVGFNHNIMYKGEVYHIQTEDSGVANPHIVTLLYQAGTIIGSRKTSYADIIKMDNLDKVVEELMKEQHKEMLRRLKAGDYDERIARLSGGDEAPGAPVAERSTEAAAVLPPQPSAKPPQTLDEIILEFLLAGEEK